MVSKNGAGGWGEDVCGDERHRAGLANLDLLLTPAGAAYWTGWPGPS